MSGLMSGWKLFAIIIVYNSQSIYYLNTYQNVFVYLFTDRVEDSKGGFMSGRMSGWKLFAIIIVAFGLVVCGKVTMVAIENRQDAQRKRFY